MGQIVGLSLCWGFGIGLYILRIFWVTCATPCFTFLFLTCLFVGRNVVRIFKGILFLFLRLFILLYLACHHFGIIVSLFLVLGLLLCFLGICWRFLLFVQGLTNQLALLLVCSLGVFTFVYFSGILYYPVFLIRCFPVLLLLILICGLIFFC